MFHYFACDNPVETVDNRIYVEVSKEKLAELANKNILEKGNVLALVKIDNESNAGHIIMYFEMHKIIKE